MKRSTHLATFSGIKVSVHWTFYLLMGWLLLSGLLSGGIISAAMNGIFLAASFLCVVMHEYGHAFAARIFGIPTHGITLYPIGGVAELDRIPRNPFQEIVIALAGPAVNVVFAVLLLPVAWVVSSITLTPTGMMMATVVERLLMVNIALVLFNLIPAFPMDGGRVFRASCALVVDYLTATRLAVRTGQAVALGLAVLGLFYNPMLLFLAAFVAFAAETELYGVITSQRETQSICQPVIDAVRVAPGRYAAAFRSAAESRPKRRVTIVLSDSNYG